MKLNYGEYWRLLKKYLIPYWPKLIILSLLMAFSLGMSLSLPQLIKYYIDHISNPGIGTLILCAYAYIITVVIRLATNTVSIYLSENLGWLAANRLRSDLTLHCMNLDMDFHKSHTSGEMIERVDGDVSFLADFLSLFIVNFLGNIALVGGILVILFTISFTLSLAIGAVSVAIIITLFFSQKMVTPFWIKARQSSADLFGYIEEHLVGKEDIVALGVEKYTVDELSTTLDNYKQKNRKANLVGSLVSLSTLSLFNIGDAVGLGLATFLFLNGSVTLGTAYLIFNYSGLLYRPLQELRGNFNSLQRIGASIHRISELFNQRTKVTCGNKKINRAASLSLEFKDVSFQYRENETVLNNISFKVEENKVLGVIGRTGSGKSTLSQLILKLYEPNNGIIRLNGINIKSYDLSDYRQSIVMVTQNIQLFHASVRDNVTLFSTTISDQQIFQTMKELGLEPWIKGLANGLDTCITPGELSTGEAQLLAFSRVYLMNPRLLILDEPTAFIDPYTASLIEKSMQKITRNRLVIIIAHRFGTLNLADYILQLDKGNIKEFGLRKELEKNPNSSYYHLMSMDGVFE